MMNPHDDFDAILHAEDHGLGEARRDAGLAVLRAAHAVESETSAHALGAAIDADLSLHAKLAALLEESHLTLRAAHATANRAIAELGLVYAPGETGAEELYRLRPLHDDEISERTGLAPGQAPKDDRWPIGIATLGAWVLSTVGIGSLLFDRSAERLFGSPGLLLLAAAGSAAIVVSGGFLLARVWSAAGSAAGDGREDPGVGRLLVLTAFPALVLGVLDGVGLQAANAVREYGQAALGLPVYLLAGFAISSIYVGFRSAMAYHGAFGAARRNRFAGIRGKDLDDQKDEARNRVEVGFAAEALGDVAVQERAIPELEAVLPRLTERIVAYGERQAEKVRGAPRPDADDVRARRVETKRLRHAQRASLDREAARRRAGREARS